MDLEPPAAAGAAPPQFAEEYPKSPSVENHEICSEPISADPIGPFPNLPFLRAAHPDGLSSQRRTVLASLPSAA